MNSAFENLYRVLKPGHRLRNPRDEKTKLSWSDRRKLKRARILWRSELRESLLRVAAGQEDDFSLQWTLQLFRVWPNPPEQLRERAALIEQAIAEVEAMRSGGSPQLGYLWSRDHGDWPKCARENGWIRHPITRITAKRVFIANEPLERDLWRQDLRQQRSFDRKDLEKQGYAWARTRNHDEWFYNDSGRARFEAEQPNWRAEEAEKGRRSREFREAMWGNPLGRTYPLLQLTTPFSRDDVMRKFRQRALELHPDHGGDAAQFRQLVMEKEQALRLCTA
jgi:hypothetical protein